MSRAPQFECWDREPLALPPRSRLYSLTPIGIGSMFVESLTGYVSCLSDAHAVSVGDLVGRELSLVSARPQRPFGPFVPRDGTTKSHGFRGRACSANCWGERASRWVGALERATHQTNLRFLTLLPFENVFSRGGLFRSIRSWCPICYEDWRCAGTIVYEPLLWTIKSATICLRHDCSLEEVCPHCHETMPPLGTYARPGSCSKCLQWLGRSGVPKPVGQSDNEARITSELWRTKAVAELLAAMPQLDFWGDAFKANLRACIEDVAEGNVLAFAEVVQLSRPGLNYLISGKGLPELATLLRVCQRADVPLPALLTRHPVADDATWGKLKQALQFGRKDSRVPLARSSEQVRGALREAAHEQPSPSLTEIARRLDYKGVDGLRNVDDALSKLIVANYRKSGQTHWWRKPGAARICELAQIRALLEQSLSEQQPRSLYQLAVNIGYVNEGYIQRKFPQICGAIRQKIRKNNEERICKMERALEDALTDEPSPSLDDLRRRLGYSCSTVLKNHFPVLYDEILARRRLHRRQKILELKMTLRSTLLDVPAPSFVSLCKTLKTPEHTLAKMCPCECASIRARYRQAREETSARRKEQLRQEVRQIIQRLHGEGKYPTIKQVRILLGQRNKWAEVSTAVATARKEFGVATQTFLSPRSRVNLQQTSTSPVRPQIGEDATALSSRFSSY